MDKFDKSELVGLQVRTSLETLAEGLASDMSSDDLLGLILRIDHLRADLQFSEELHTRLGHLIAAEKSANP